MITDPAEAADRMLRLVTIGKLRAIDGQEMTLEPDTICTHSDTPGAVAIVQAVQARLEQRDIQIRPVFSV